jgi:radical SAM superfamily enzyme YgiQ (UPF0313 family)
MVRTKGILVSYSGYPYTPSSLMPDNGLANLAGSLKREGHEVIVLDFGTVETIKELYPQTISEKIKPIYRKISEGRKPSFSDKVKVYYLNSELERHQRKQVKKIAQYIEKVVNDFGADFVGLKLWNGDGFTGSLAIAEYLKKVNPKLKVFAGGPHADLFKDLILKKTRYIDAVACWDGENIICKLAEYAGGDRKNLSEIPNVIYRDESGKVRINKIELIKDLDSLPEPLYDEDIYPSMKGNQKIKIITFDESRGCPFNCYFCAQPAKSGHYTRMKSPEKIVKEIEHIIQKYGINVFRYAGSSTPGKLMLKVAKKLKEKGIRVKYTSFAEANLVNDEEEMKYLKDSGLVSLFFGIESGSQKMLDSVHKCLKVDVLKKALKSSKKAGIYTVGSLIYPLPGETSETRKETLRFLEETRPDSVPVQFAGLYPGTPWFSESEKFGFQVDKEKYPERVMDYKIKLLFPPTMWKDPGYKIDGKRFKEFSKETMKMIKDIERMGILTGVSDDQFLMAEFAGMSPKEFRDKNREYFFTGDYEKIGEMVEKINRNICKVSLLKIV